MLFHLVQLLLLSQAALSFPAGLSTSTKQKLTVSKVKLVSNNQVSVPASDNLPKSDLINGTCYNFSNVTWEFRNMSSLTPGECMVNCSSLGYFYAAVQGGSVCFCGNDQPPLSTIVTSQECHTNCTEDESQKCGGDNAGNVFELYTVSTFESNNSKTKIKISTNQTFTSTDEMVFSDAEFPPIDGINEEHLLAPTHLLESGFLNGSCYKVSNVSWEYRNISSINPGECMAKCSSLGYFYAAVQGGSVCFCGNDQPPQSTIVTSQDCQTNCTEDESQKCDTDSANKMNVFQMYTGSTFQSNNSKTKIRIGISTRIRFSDPRWYIKD